uniref:Potassium two pore domain channel subfamily K member 4 n=1 Tax=Neogobius melanostomus TaxID=47308 RepID=A0A8C6UNW2_9GOBI
MRCSTLLGILTGVLLYLLPREERKHMRLQDMRRYFLENFTCVGPENLQEFIEEVVEAIGAGVLATENTTFVSQWDLASAFFFSGTIITTIGFGNISPKTDGGQLFCIFYALVGIPMFGFLLAGVGGHLGTGLRKAVLKIEMIFLKFRVSPTIVRIISAILSILLGVGLFVAVPIGIFQEVEGWTLLESAYFVVITLTTVGFGDYVAGDSGYEGSDHWYKPLVWFWILLGLAYFASVLTMIGNWLRVLSKKTRAEVLSIYFIIPLPSPPSSSSSVLLCICVRWRHCRPMPLIGLKTFKTCRWISRYQGISMTLSDDAGERGITEATVAIIVATATTCQVQVPRRGTKGVKAGAAQSRNHPTPRLLTHLMRTHNRVQSQGPRPRRQTECLNRNLQSLNLSRPICLTSWTTLGKTWPLLTNPRMRRAEHCIWILPLTPQNATACSPVNLRGDATEGISQTEARGTTIRQQYPRQQNPMGTQSPFQIHHQSLKTT